MRIRGLYNVTTLFGELLRTKRAVVGMNQAALAKKIGLGTGRTISYWEAGKSLPAIKYHESLAGFLEISPAELKHSLSAPSEASQKPLEESVNILPLMRSIVSSPVQKFTLEDFTDLLFFLQKKGLIAEDGTPLISLRPEPL